jgi:hypothetical protein
MPYPFAMLITSRSYREYAAMFDLHAGELDGLVVDCCAGASSFVAELAARGGTGLAVDPIYAQGRAALTTAARASRAGTADIIAAHPDRFVWHWYGTPEHRDRLRERAADRFVEDIDRRPHAYLAAELPRLPVRDRAARLVLCSHLLFTWSDTLDFDWHRAALAELLRITNGEVRVFPLVVQRTGEPVPFLGALVDRLRADGFDVSVREVGYEFQRGAHAMLVIAPSQGGRD